MINTVILAQNDDWNHFTKSLKEAILKNTGPVLVTLRNGRQALVEYDGENGVTDVEESFFEKSTSLVWHVSGISIRSSDFDIISFDPKTGAVPAIKSQWIHKNGNRYVVVNVANQASERPDEYPVTVVYEGADGRVWSRPLDAWYGAMTAC
ncbi:hypothetical protein [Comamonas thiooxydans]|uniref:hypothetical protein n=1 Tax=Comamonas thiooxydans TaxID=363952 RepID=UPI000B4106F4|nr:hypothetical protein [Comamonas thiooxydans]